MKLSKGFTLIEMMIVACIMGILAAIAYPSYMSSVERGRLSECSTFANTLAYELEKFNQQFSTYTGDIIGAGGLNLGVGADMNETGTCQAVINAVDGSCDVNDPAERCFGYVINVSRINVAPSFAQCETLTLDNRGQKGVASGGTVNDCWN